MSHSIQVSLCQFQRRRANRHFPDGFRRPTRFDYFESIGGTHDLPELTASINFVTSSENPPKLDLSLAKRYNGKLILFAKW